MAKMKKDKKEIEKDFTDIDMELHYSGDWMKLPEIDTGKIISIRKSAIEAYYEDVLNPTKDYKGPYKKGTVFTRVFTSGNWYEVAAPVSEVEKWI